MSSATEDDIIKKCVKRATLETLKFDNVALRELPLDSVSDNCQRLVKGACFSRCQPTPVLNPRIVVHSSSAMELLGLTESELHRPEFAEYFSGNQLLPGSEPAAHCYCGHQFGYFAGQLGDGAAMYLGEVLNHHGERWEFQLKGSGKTPYSRTADGRKVLRSSIREFLCSEAMFYLGIPTTRAGCCLTSDSTVVRDVFYSGNPVHENCAIITRIAPSFIRFGSFQICKGPDRETGRDGPSAGRPDVLHQLADYVIRNFFPEVWRSRLDDRPETMYVEFFKEVVKRTALLVAQWQCVGFCHGVLNTDNMSILGLTIDYGPFGFLDRYDPNHICNASDDGDRYTYAKQPEICKWNCMKLAEALSLLAPLDQLLAQLECFDDVFQQHYMHRMHQKLGLLTVQSECDSELIESLFDTMYHTGADFTNTFIGLSQLSVPSSDDSLEAELAKVKSYLLGQCATVDELASAYAPRMDQQQLAMLLTLLESTPELLQQMGKGFRQVAIELERHEKLQKVKQLTAASKAEQDDALWDAWLRKYMQRLQQEISSASDIESVNMKRRTLMKLANPKFILRNYIAQTAIDAAEKDDFSEVRHLLTLLQHPYDEPSVHQMSATAMPEDSGDNISVKYGCKPPAWASRLRVT